jgi:uncharacterized membrane protein YfcA
MDFLAAMLVAVLSGMGVGSGGLFVVYLTLVKGIEQSQAQSMNLVFFLFASGASLLVHLRKRKIDFGSLITVIFPGVIFAVLGSIISSKTSSEILRFCFGIFLLISGVTVLLKECKKHQKRLKNSRK